jgi:hypothetical protein
MKGISSCGMEILEDGTTKMKKQRLKRYLLNTILFPSLNLSKQAA